MKEKNHQFSVFFGGGLLSRGPGKSLACAESSGAEETGNARNLFLFGAVFPFLGFSGK